MALDRALAMTDAVGHATRSVYDAAGRLTTSVDVLGHTTATGHRLVVTSTGALRHAVTTDRGRASQSETKWALLTPDEVVNMREDELLVKMP